MSAASCCEECGERIKGDSPEGLCPRCLLELPPKNTPDATVSLPGKALSTSAESRASLTLGEKFGHYRIIRLLGRGGMGEVYEARDLKAERVVALKLLREKLDSPKAQQRFLREGRLAAQVSHPNVVYVYGSEEIEGIPVISMEFMSEGTLKDRVKGQGPLPVREAVDAIVQISAGLAAADKQGVLHRDVKPSNCFVNSEGVVKIGDFGLSISISAREETQLTVSGSFLGTPAFASPEQLKGEALDLRTDIYSLGATLYYLLTGRPPFKEANFLLLLNSVLCKEPIPPRKFRPEIPRRLAKTILRCLEKEKTVSKHPSLQSGWGYWLLITFAAYGAFFEPRELGRRAGRFVSYSDLISQLAPFASRKPSGANVRSSPVSETVLPSAVSSLKVGPYKLIEQRPFTDKVTKLGWDPILRRKVWLQFGDAGESLATTSVRMLSRSGRLRWLNFGRQGPGHWDAYEAPDGQPISEFLQKAQEWFWVREWLFQIANEIKAASQDGTLREIALRRIWITLSGTIKILTFPILGQREPPLNLECKVDQLASVQRFLSVLACLALSGGTSFSESELQVALPIKARECFRKLDRQSFETIDFLVHEMSGLREMPAELNSPSRLRQIGIQILIFLFGLWIGVHFLSWSHSITIAVLAVISILSSVTLRNNIVFILTRTAIVLKSGEKATRLSVLTRGLVTWVSLLGLAGLLEYFGFWPDLQGIASVLLPLTWLGIFLVALLLRDPTRGPQDRISRTWLVPE